MWYRELSRIGIIEVIRHRQQRSARPQQDQQRQPSGTCSELWSGFETYAVRGQGECVE